MVGIEQISSPLLLLLRISQLFCRLFDSLSFSKILELNHSDVLSHQLVIKIWLHFIFLQEINSFRFDRD